MPLEETHLWAADHHKKLAASLLNQSEPSWAVVLAFYSAVHYVEACYARQGIHSTNHGKRRENLSRVPALDEVVEDYRELQVHSLWVRYEVKQVMTPEAQSLIDNELAHIEARATALLDNS